MTLKNNDDELHVDINLTHFLKNFGEVFSGEQICIQELLQNSRRANASKIQISINPTAPCSLTIKDDGSGISDFQTLLTLGQSDWDRSTTKNENPFGLGFFAMLYAAKRIKIKSNNQCLLFSPEEILNGGTIQSSPCQTPIGTEIDILFKNSPWQSKTPTDDEIKGQIEKIVAAFPIPVIFSGEKLSRPYALDQWEGLRFILPDEGTALVELNPKYNKFYPLGQTYFQGLNIAKETRTTNPWPDFGKNLEGLKVYMHLDSKHWRIRVPDQSALYESTETYEKIKTTKEHLKKAITEYLASNGNVKAYFSTLLAWESYGIVRGIEIPTERWKRFEIPIHLPHYDYNHIENFFECLDVIDIPSPQNDFLFILDLDSIEVKHETISHLLAAYLFKIPILKTWNDPEHWFATSVSSLSLEEFYKKKLSVEAPDTEIIAEQIWEGKNIVLCNRFTVKLEGYGVREFEESIFINNTFWITNDPLNKEYPIDQAFVFQNEFGEFDEAGYQETMRTFSAIISSMNGDLCSIVQNAIRPFSEILEENDFSVNITKGNVTVSINA